MTDKYTPAIEAVRQKQIDKLSDVRGTLVEVSDYSHYLFLVFDDGRFALFESVYQWEGTTSIEFRERDYFNPDDIYHVRLGLISIEEYEEYIRFQSQQEHIEREKLERKQYEMLKAKFEKLA